MQKSRQQRDGRGDPQSEAVSRQKRFALVLCGDELLAKRLVARLASMNVAKGEQDLSPAALQFFRLQKLYELWVSEDQGTTKELHIFQPGHENEAIEKGLDPSMAQVLGELPSLYRAILLLIYGENFSYAATAQLLNISIEELMGALSAARHGFFAQKQREDGQQPASTYPAHMPGEAEYEASYDPAC